VVNLLLTNIIGLDGPCSHLSNCYGHNIEAAVRYGIAVSALLSAAVYSIVWRVGPKDAEFFDGVVVDYASFDDGEGVSFSPVIEWSDGRGISDRFTSTNGSNSKSWKIGSLVRVRVSKGKAEHFDPSFKIWGTFLLATIVVYMALMT